MKTRNYYLYGALGLLVLMMYLFTSQNRVIDQQEHIKDATADREFVLANDSVVFLENDKLENFTTDSWGHHLRTNLRTPALLSKEFAKNIRAKNNNIINIIDQRVFKLTPYFFSYTISKTGLYT